MLSITELRKRLGGMQALDGCSLRAAVGERLVIRGANGAGKSTLLKIVAGVLSPDAGSVSWQGQSLSSGSTRLRRQVGYVPETADPPGHLHVADLLHFIAALKTCSLLPIATRQHLGVEELMGACIDELSLGQRRRACLAAALTGDPDLLLLDEPTNGLDAAAMDVLADLLVAHPTRTVLLATHDDDFAERVGTRRVVMTRGRVVEG